MKPDVASMRDARHAAELLELGDAFLEVDREWRVARVNRRLEELSRLPRAQALGRTLGEVWPIAWTPGTPYWREYHRCMEERVPVQFEAYHAPFDLWASVTAYPVSDGGIAVFFRDVTAVKKSEEEKKRAEDELRASEERFRLLANAMPHIVCVLLPDGSAEYVNPSWTAFSGLDLAATRREGWERVLHPDDLETARACRRRALKSLQAQDVEVRYRSADGTYRWYMCRLAPVVDGARVARLVGSAMDIEDRKRAEDALRQSEALARSVSERLQQADRRKDEFLGMLSHELRNPLAPIRNALYLLDHAEPSGQQSRRAREILSRQVAHVTRLVDDLLDVTRIARGKVELRRSEVDLVALARRTVDDHRPLLSDRGLELRIVLPPAPVVVDGDETRLSQVLGNLLHNASKFTPAGGQVTLAVGHQAEEAVVHVRDTGVGMDAETLTAIFEPFVQARQTLARSEGGLGLGLALVRGLVALHGGGVTARSAGRGRGTEFEVRLPLRRPRALPGAAPGSRSDRVAPSTRRRVLVVDDNRDAAETLAELLAMGGHEVEVAHDGPSALALATARPPDVVLCDIGLPGMDGYEFARQFRARSPRADVRLIAVSGYAQPEDVSRASEAGFDGHVAKPPDPERLVTLIG